MLSMGKLYSVLVFMLLFIFSANTIFAQENNKFGIHITDESDLEDAANLVNSSGGSWGYVTFVIREDEINLSRWQNVFDKMRRLKLIPIVRIATKIDGNNWQIPKAEDAHKWSEFFSQLNWPTKEHFIILFNEANHSKEWGGRVDPVSYTKLTNIYYEELKSLGENFKILPAGIDLAASNTNSTMEASKFFKLVYSQDKDFFKKFDYWNSHSYPNPGFSGSVQDTGKKSIQGYIWEKEFLEDYGLDPNIKVFITETGWIRKSLSDEQISKYYRYAYEQIWNGPQIMAVTPFILNYEAEPFSGFSLMNRTKKEYTKAYEQIKDLSKVEGAPEQINAFEIEDIDIPKRLVAQSSYLFKITLKNTGQSIWNETDGFSMHYQTNTENEKVKIWDIPETEPSETADIIVQIETNEVGKQKLVLSFNKNGQEFGQKIEREFEILTPPSLEIKALGWFGTKETSDEYKILLTDQNRTILSLDNFEIIQGIGNIPALYNVVPGNEYRLRLERKFHLYKEKLVKIDEVRSSVDFGRLLPDVSFWDLISNPYKLEKRILPL